MKWSMAAFLALLLAAAVALPAAAQLAARDGEAVTYTPVVQYGDESAAEGIEVRVTRNWDWRLYWDTVWTPEGSETELRLVEREPGGVIQLDIEESVPKVELGVEFEYSSANLTRFDGALAELRSELDDSGSIETDLKISDWYDYYPMSFDIEFPNVLYISLNELSAAGSRHVPGRAGLYETLSTFFRIPVRPDDTLAISVGNYSVSMDMDGVPRLESMSAVIGGAAYFTFGCDRELDLSLIPGGWGVYRLPFDENGVHADELENVYSFGEGVEPLYLGKVGDNLALHTEENGVYFITVFEPESMSVLQRFELFETGGAEITVYEGEGFVTAFSDDGKLAALTESGGVCELCAMGERVWDMENDSVSMAFSGDRLAVVGNMYNNSFSYDDNYLAFFLAVYGPEGLRYMGEYACSLEDVSHELHCCLPFMDEFEVCIRG